jgi:hypothetical protein
MEARMMIAEREVPSPKSDFGEDEYLFDIDCEEIEMDVSPKMAADDFTSRAPFQFGNGFAYGRSLLSKLEESIEEEEESEGQEQEGFADLPASQRIPTISNISMSLKNTILGEKNQKNMKYVGPKPENGYVVNTSSGHRSANEQLPASVSFVKLADMNDEEWTLFKEKFQDLLNPAFAKRKSVTVGQRQRQRLGTSCQF